MAARKRRHASGLLIFIGFIQISVCIWKRAPRGQTLFYFDLFAVLFFAISGALRAAENRFDLIGILVLSIAVGVGGGLMRDVLLGLTPPVALLNPWYLGMCVLGGLLVFFFWQRVRKLHDSLHLADAIGLGVIAAIGATKAQGVGLGLPGIVLCGTISAVGGGLIRDVLVGEIPMIFRTTSSLYASTAIVGTTLYWLLLKLDAPHKIAFAVCALAAITLRVLAIKFSWTLPSVHRIDVPAKCEPPTPSG